MAKRWSKSLCVAAWLALSAQGAGWAEGLPPMADIHLHFNWDHEEVIDAASAVQKLREQNVVLAVVFSVPTDMALDLSEAGGDWIIPLFSPYLDPRRRQGWYNQEELIPKARAALAAGHYAGIGEVHVIPGFGPRLDNPALVQLIALAGEYDVPFVLHTDTSDPQYVVKICKSAPRTRFLWAHAGGQFDAPQVGEVLAACDNFWVELSARDPWHYGAFLDAEGRLSSQWTALMQRYPDRFMTGTDPVWNAQQMYRWYEADEGWNHYGRLNQWHRKWMAQLPDDLHERVRLTNAQDFFRRKGRPPNTP